MKLKDFKKLNESWNKWRLTEGKLQYSVQNTGYGDYYRFFDESGKEAQQSLGMMVLDLVDAGVGGWAPEEQIDRMMAVNADPNRNQGGMQRWDSNVFEDYYEADNQKILQAWAKMNNMELEQVPDPDAEPEYEDDGTNDFEEYYSESKKRNKIHEGRMKEMEMQLADEIVDLLINRGAVRGGINDYGEAAEYLKAGIIPLMESLADAPAGSVSPMEEAVSPEQQEANEKAYSRCFEMGRKGIDVKSALRSGPTADFAACRAGHQDGANEFRQSLPSEHDLQERTNIGWSIFERGSRRPYVNLFRGTTEGQFSSKEEAESFLNANWGNRRKGSLSIYVEDVSLHQAQKEVFDELGQTFLGDVDDLQERIKKTVIRKLQEKAKSKNQQQFMGMVKKCQETGDCASAEVKRAADSMKKGDVDDFARTKHKGLPDTVEDKK